MINVKKGYSLETQNVIASKKTYTFLHYQTIILSILYNHYKKKSYISFFILQFIQLKLYFLLTQKTVTEPKKHHHHMAKPTIAPKSKNKSTFDLAKTHTDTNYLL